MSSVSTRWLVLRISCLLPSFCIVDQLLAASPQNEPTEAPIHYAIVVTGGELLDGVYPDSHTHFLAQTLRPLGLHCVASVTVDDRREDIIEALRFLSAKARIVIVTGGLGPTDNDISRQTLEKFTGIPLEENEKALQAMEKRLGKPRGEIPANQRRQCLIPKGGDFLPNANGTAAGLLFDTGEKIIVALPGPPRELEPMVRGELVPRLKQRFGVHSPGASLLVRFVGIGQSGVDQTMKQKNITLPEDVILQSQFEGRRVDFTFLLPHDTPEGRARLETLKNQLQEHLGKSIYAFDATSLEQLLIRGLIKQGKTLAVAEVGTGGALAANLNRESGAADAVAGAFSAPTGQALARILHIPDADWAKTAAGKDQTNLLASAAAKETGSQWAIAIGEPEQANPAGEKPLTAVVRAPDRSAECLRFNLRGPAEVARANLVTELLGEIRHRWE